MSQHPPKIPLKFFRWFCNPEYTEDLEGDLLESFEYRLENYGIKRARLLFIKDIIQLFKPGLIRSWEGTQKLNQMGILKNNLKVGYRNILKHKALFGINISGLAIGIAVCMIISLFVFDELSYDRYNEKADRIARVVVKGVINGEELKEAVSQAPVAATLQREFPEVLEGTRLRQFGTPKVFVENYAFRNNRLAYVDPNFFKVFTLPGIYGDLNSALTNPNKVVITETHAVKFFGEIDPLGKTIKIENNGDFEVTGVIKDVPENSHFHFDLFASMVSLEDSKSLNWLQSNYHNYLLLSEHASYLDLSEKLPAIVEKYMGPEVEEFVGMTMSEFRSAGNDLGLFLQPLTDIHLKSDFTAVSQLEEGGDIQVVYIFSAIALVMLIIASMNYMNLSTASASKRAKEVGIKKVLGFKKGQLINQFMIESILSTGIAILLSIVLVLLFLPVFNELSGKNFQLAQLLSASLIPYYFGFWVLVSLLAGLYPAFILSSFKPLAVLKNKLTGSGGTKNIRNGLVIFQFVISACLIIMTLAVNQQMNFIQNKDLGYDREQMIVIRDSGVLGDQEKAFKERLLSDPRIDLVSRSGYVPAGPSNTSMIVVHPKDDPEGFRRTIIYEIDESYIPALGMRIVEGRNFSKDFGDETSKVIVNETAARVFKLGSSPVGKSVSLAVDSQGGINELKVIGLIKDFHFKSLHTPIEPVILLYKPNPGLLVKVNTHDIIQLGEDLDKIWQEFDADEPFEYATLSESYEETYSGEKKLGTVVQIFAMLTILIACLGLFGLVTFTAEQRKKEMGIRKVLGSTIAQIVSLLSYDFLKLVGISFLIAFPLGYYLVDVWLQDFKYRIQLSWWMFLSAALITLVIAAFTLSYKSLKVALSNPVESIRHE